MSLYYEVHVTLDPVEGTKRTLLEMLCKSHGFRLAAFEMRGRTANPDAFCSTRTNLFEDAQNQTRAFVRAARENGFILRRYKIEEALVDSKIMDILELLS